MGNLSLNTPITETTSLPEPKPNLIGAETDGNIEAPIEDVVNATLNAVGIDDLSSNLPEEAQENVSEVGKYINDILKAKGITPTQTSFKRTLDDLKFEMGLDYDADPDVVLDRIGGVVKAWKNLSFIRDPRQKRSIFMKLARMNSSSEMNRAVFEAMEKEKVWQ